MGHSRSRFYQSMPIDNALSGQPVWCVGARFDKCRIKAFYVKSKSTFSSGARTSTFTIKICRYIYIFSTYTYVYNTHTHIYIKESIHSRWPHEIAWGRNSAALLHRYYLTRVFRIKRRLSELITRRTMVRYCSANAFWSAHISRTPAVITIDLTDVSNVVPLSCTSW